MDRDSYGDQQFYEVGTADDDIDPCTYMNEMTQDVIEWDESKNKDLDQVFRSPQPPGSGTKGSNSNTKTGFTRNSSTHETKRGTKSRTPSSTLTSNSSLFMGVRRNLDPICQRVIGCNEDRREKAVEEIDMILSSLRKKDTETTNSRINKMRHSLPASESLLQHPDDPTPKRHGSKRQAKGELRRHHTHAKSNSTATSLAQRHRRRRVDYAHESVNEYRNSGSEVASSTMTSTAIDANCTTPVTTNSTQAVGNSAQSRTTKNLATSDDFAELLEALTTPNSSRGETTQSRFPLSSIDDNVKSHPMANTTAVDSKSSGSACTEEPNTSFKMMPDESLVRTLPGQQISATIPLFRHYSQFENKRAPPKPSSRGSKPEESSSKPSEDALKTKDLNNDSRGDERENQYDADEFDDIEFSEADFAKIDSLTQPATSSHHANIPTAIQSSCNKQLPIQKSTKNLTPKKTTMDEINQKNKRPIEDKQTTPTRSDGDEFGDFPSEIDFTEIDAMVSSQPFPSNNKEETRSSAQTALQTSEVTSTVIHVKSCTTSSSDRSCDNVTNSMDRKEVHRLSEEDEEDEFGDFPTDIDFDELDAMVATQCFHSKLENSKASRTPLSSLSKDDSNKLKNNQSKPTGLSATEDEFDDFLDDFDFSSLDRDVSERMISKDEVKVDPTGPIRNRRMRSDPGELSFMKFSRYKVLSLGNDERRGIKTLKVAIWRNSMLQNGEEEKNIHKKGNLKMCSSGNLDEISDLASSLPQDINFSEDGLIYLCGEWYFTPVVPGDIIHVCSLTGQFQTDVTALPIVLHSYPPPGSDVDDLILVLHPDMLLTPSIISETSSCNRRAALKSKLGSSGLSSKSAFIGTMRHGLFEACMKSSEFDSRFAKQVIKKLLREKAEMLIGCNVSESEASVEVLNVLPMIQEFAGQYTTLRKDLMVLSSLGKPVGGVACHPDIRLLGKRVHSVEENIVSTAIGLKGSIDAVMETESTIIGNKINQLLPASTKMGRQQSLMCFELKTGHNQNAQNVHMAQLSLYTFMLQSRYGSDIQLYGNRMIGTQSETKIGMKGAAPGGILLYLNEKSQQISHVSPQLNEVKTLMSQRNVVASNSKRASRLRGITLCYEDGNRLGDDKYLTAKLIEAPPADLPQLKFSSHSCKRCYSNRECMLYAASDPETNMENQRDLLSQFTGHLKEDDLAYFRKWDRLIDIEADASSTKTAAAWLVDSRTRESEHGESISGLTFDAGLSREVGTSAALLCFRRKVNSSSQPTLESLNVAPCSHVILSTDGTLLDDFIGSAQKVKRLRNRMHITKGYVDRIEGDKVFISTGSDEMNQVKILLNQYQEETHDANGNILPGSLVFRLDKNASSVGTGTLRWNLINFLTGDYTIQTKEESTELDERKRHRLTWLRDIVVRLKSPDFGEDAPSSLFNGDDLQISGCSFLELSKEYSQLNDAQQKAVRKVMVGRDYTLIQGLPGTGKTSVLSFLARLLVAQGCRVLITAYTHSAVDNIMQKLMEKGMGSRSGEISPLIRVGQRKSCHESVKPIIYSEVARELDRMWEKRNVNTQAMCGNDENPSAAALKKVVKDARIVGVSALSLPRSPLLNSEHFDVVIIDEAGQMNEPTALGVLSSADSFVLVGDHKQLPPLVNSVIAESGGYGISLLKRLAETHPHAVAPLTIQYRMNEAICKISSESVYGGLMKCGNAKVKSQILNLPGFPSKLPRPVKDHNFDWLKLVVDPERPVIFVDTDKIRTTLIESDGITESQKSKFEALEGKIGGQAGGSIVNRAEVTLVRYVIKGLYSCGHNLCDIGVISPFRAQVRILEENPMLRSWKKEGLEVSTIDRYQGRDKSTIILSLVRSNEKGSAGRLLQDSRRLNVALTRAKCKLVVIGSYGTLVNGSVPLKPILNRMTMRNQRIQPSESAIACYEIS